MLSLFSVESSEERVSVYVCIQNFVKASHEMKKLSIQVLYIERSVCMAAKCDCSPISTVPTNEQLLVHVCEISDNGIDKTKALFRVYTKINQATMNRFCTMFTLVDNVHPQRRGKILVCSLTKSNSCRN